jgi:O-antigen/teichoic acid export membrane protein
MTTAESSTPIVPTRVSALRDRVFTRPPETARAAASPGRPARLADRLAGKSVLSLIDQAMVSGVSFLAQVLLGRTQTDLAELGLYALGFAILVVIVNIHASLVVAPYTFFANHIGDRRRGLLTGSTLVQHALLSLSLCLVLFVGAGICWQAAPAIAPVLFAIALGAPLVLSKELARRACYAELNVKGALAIDAAAGALQIALMVALVAFGKLGAASAHAAIGVAASAPALVWLAIVWRRLCFRARAVRVHSIRAARFGGWVLADQMFAVASGYFSHWTLAFVVGPIATGAFAACLNVVQLANPLIFGMGNVMEPKASAAIARGGRPALARMVLRSTLLIGAAMAVFSLGFLVAGEWLISLIYGKPIAAGSPWLIPLLTLAAVLMALNVGVIHGLRAAQQSQANLVAGVFHFAATLAVALVGIPSCGLLAAAAAMAAGNAAGLVVRVACFIKLCSEGGDRRTGNQCGDTDYAAAGFERAEGQEAAP